jgi:hypothetical protein
MVHLVKFFRLLDSGQSVESYHTLYTWAVISFTVVLFVMCVLVNVSSPFVTVAAQARARVEQGTVVNTSHSRCVPTVTVSRRTLLLLLLLLLLCFTSRVAPGGAKDGHS